MPSRDETRAAERAAGVSQSERFALELEFVMSLANPRYIHRACPGHTNQPPRESIDVFNPKRRVLVGSTHLPRVFRS